VMVSVPAQHNAWDSAVDEDQELGKFDVRHNLVAGGWWLATDFTDHQPPPKN
jgi:hypothetical protein